MVLKKEKKCAFFKNGMTSEKRKRIGQKRLTVKNSVLLLSCACMLFSASCSTTAKEPKDYKPITFLRPFVEDKEWEIVLRDAKEPTEKQMEVCRQVMEKVRQTCTINKEMPKVVVMPDDFLDGGRASRIFAKYYTVIDTIVVPESFDETFKSYFCHELMHYISDNNNELDSMGIEYAMSNGKESFAFGIALNDALANYFSTKIYKHPDGLSIYEFETHVAAELATVYGEEKLWEAYTTGEYSDLKEHFNANVGAKYRNKRVDGVDLTPFEIMQTTLDDYQCLLLGLDRCIENHGVEETLKRWTDDMNTIEVMMFDYGTSAGKCIEVQNEMKNLLSNCSIDLSFPDLSRIEELSTDKTEEN